MARIIIVGTLTLLVIVAVTVLGFWYITTKVSLEEEPYADTTVSTVLTRENDFYAQANEAANAGDYRKAEELFIRALADSKDRYQGGQIRFKIAQMRDLQNDLFGAIDLYKQIVAGADYTWPAKAYSVSAMAEMIFRNGDPEIQKAIFQGEPYASMVVEGDKQRTYRVLNEYASSFYPLGLPEMRIAAWYANDLAAARTASKGTRPEFADEHMRIIREKITNADADVALTINDPNVSGLVPLILTRKALVLGILAAAGEVPVEDAEKAYQQAFQLGTLRTGKTQNDGMLRYYYANFLATLGDEKSPEVKAVLEPLYTDQLFASSSAHSFFRSERTNALGHKRRLQILASIDPQFGQLLRSLGWTEQDILGRRR